MALDVASILFALMSSDRTLLASIRSFMTLRVRIRVGVRVRVRVRVWDEG